MNVYALIIFIALVADFLLGVAADLLNLKALKPELPAEFTGVYDATDYAKSQQYTRVKTKFGLLVSGLDLLVMLIFWFAGGFNRLDLLVRGWGSSSVSTGLAYIGLLLLVRAVLSLPFSIYSTFVIEERFGFNRTKPLTFVLDHLKGLVLAMVIGGPLLAAVLVLLESGGPLAWLYCWLATAVFTLFIQFVAPTWIMPIFNKFTPLAEGELKEMIMAYAKSVGFSLENIFVMDGSRRTAKSNAFFTGFGRHKRIALFDTLIAQHSTGELVAILAHEIGHYKKRHIQQALALGILHLGVMFYLLSVFISHPGLFAAFYMEHPSIYAGLLFFGLLLSPLEMVLSVLIHLLSRRNEYQADSFAATTITDPEDMVRALKNLSRGNLSNLTPHPFYAFLNYSHPPVLERIRAIRTQ